MRQLSLDSVGTLSREPLFPTRYPSLLTQEIEGTKLGLDFHAPFLYSSVTPQGVIGL